MPVRCVGSPELANGTAQLGGTRLRQVTVHGHLAQAHISGVA